MKNKKNDNEIGSYIDSIFTEEWYANITEVMDIAINQAIKIGLDPYKIAYRIIDYNITKRLEECFNDTTIKKLPKKLNWKHGDSIKAFDEFKLIIDYCNSCESFEKYTLKIIFGDNNFLLNNFLMWKEAVNSYYPKINLITSPLKVKNQYKLEILRVKQ